ncbi:hypothetical protein PGT21_022936 [Puccinia graminis f. sp. tritici]|uniref:Uncharacterized protein n=1 Tax=Puccinia graminis f. sp. tritici TaxID=56615 RepID=A0A5B0P7P1_PUCGR|nr:hypothetical protein PGT21_022936 [Puccinia graminis f. sp. tritici]KAA1131817.1 hypothetical protein PGTUg99_027637 [Puccinia graminis f. sp. tritici]
MDIRTEDDVEVVVTPGLHTTITTTTDQLLLASQPGRPRRGGRELPASIEGRQM